MKNAARNTASLVLFGRAVMTTLAIASGALGFLTGVRLKSDTYDPHAYATGAAALFCAACTVIAFMLMRRRAMANKLRALEARFETIADRNWELREAQERAQSLLDAQGDVIMRRDVTGRLTYANDAFCTMAGKSRAELIGHPAALRVLEQGTVSIEADGTRIHDQKIACGPSARWIAWREVAVRTEAGTEVQGVGRDVTDRVEAERALELARDQSETANRAKSRFLATVSHEIRTPLNGILGMADLLIDTPLTAEQMTYAKAAKTSGEALLSLIEEVLDFSKIEAGRLDLEAEPFAIGALIEEAVELLAPRAQAKNIEIASYVDARLPAGLIGDAARLRQVVLNLAGNAIKFTESGGVAVIVEPGAREGEIRFEVRDTGIGLAPEDHSRVFLDFEQADGSSTRKFGGTGLGLAISRRIVAAMGGVLSIDSQPGAGASFHFTALLPAADLPAAAAKFATPVHAGQSVLIAAVSELEASLLARRLGGWGAATDFVSDADAAKAKFEAPGWHALLVDFPIAKQMIDRGDLNGCSAARRIVLIRPADRNELPALKQAGFNGYLVKPVRASSLAAALSRDGGFEPAKITPTKSELGAAMSSGSGLSILVAEDNDINALLVRALLTRLGHRVTVAGSGEAALDAWSGARAANTPFDLILMDVQMPGMDGLEAARRIRADEAVTEDQPTPILALTANAYAEDRAACLAAGMDGFLVKPLDRERLAEALDALRAARLAA